MGAFSTSECAWSQTSITILKRTLVGITGFEFKAAIEKEYLRGAGSKPIDIQMGDESYTGNIKLLKYEVDMLNDAAQFAGYESILHVPHTLILITCVYKKTESDTAKTITVPQVAFTEMPFAMEKNAKMTEVTLPFISMNMIYK
ncbi:hypothetical protein SAMN05421788_101830 [Filimonas lacunae]|uniref:Uncharacterized protein n=1 Tax=Filimonas lacunae TaxID=477680 RepID=A0A173MP34_9BACT|nr:hypothetical protein [Filimonas lacunae]BAV09394.1 hypothetical protein FLA_5442 [Filimonas lacunae]SIS72349.1 hypothetical protein SAMN05421788_101830 [Filimonas lacunae]